MGLTPESRPDPRPRRYRKIATVEARVATEAGTIDTLEGVHSYEAGDYICGPGAAGEFWPVKRAIFEETYVPVEAEARSSHSDADLRAALDVALNRLAFYMSASASGEWVVDETITEDREFVREALALTAPPAGADHE